MHLAIHVGPLTPFFGPAVRTAAAGEGAPEPDDAAVRARIEAWRAWIGDGLVRAGHLPAPPSWDEADPVPPERALLPLDAVRALKLLVVHGEDGAPPPELPVRPELDPAWVAMAESGFADAEYDQVLVPEFWLPGDFAFTFSCPWPDGHEVQTGSVGALAGQLAALREKLLGGTPFDVALWAGATAPARDLRALARRAAGCLEQMARRALERRQPMLWAPAS